jgi:hypothetical protein
MTARLHRAFTGGTVLLNIKIFAGRDDSTRSAWREPAKPTAKRQQPKAES